MTTPSGLAAPPDGTAEADGPGGPAGGEADGEARARQPAATAVRSTPTPRTVLRRGRVPLVFAAVVVVLAVAIALFGDTSRGGSLDPRSAKPAGTRALAVLLRDDRVPVRLTASADSATATAGDVVVAAFPDRLRPDELRRLTAYASGGGHVVLLDPSTDTLRAAGLPATQVSTSDRTAVPGCGLPAATVAGTVVTGGDTFAPLGVVGPGEQVCYPQDADGSLLVLPRGSGEVDVFGSPETFTNAHLDQQGDAALALGLLETGPTVRWLLPQPGRGGAVGTRQDALDLLPDRVSTAILQLLVAVVLVALWRARRLGRPVREPLPVVVRSAETVEGRARLYGAARARGTAAAALRAGARTRLAGQVGLGGAGDPQPRSLVAAVAERSGRQDAEITTLLYGASSPDDPDPTAVGPAAGTRGVPADDAELIRLADDLDRLDREVRRS